MRILKAATPLLCLAVVLGACSSGAGASASAAPTPAAASPDASASGGKGDYGSGGGAPAAGAATVNLADSSLGKILVDGTGRTLYVFTADSAGKSACAGDCAASWPPLTSAAVPTLGEGLDAEDFGTIARDDGQTQVTFYGMPLYYFGGDAAAGDTKGQGLNGKWFVVDAEGAPIQ